MPLNLQCPDIENGVVPGVWTLQKIPFHKKSGCECGTSIKHDSTVSTGGWSDHTAGTTTSTIHTSLMTTSDYQFLRDEINVSICKLYLFVVTKMGIYTVFVIICHFPILYKLLLLISYICCN